MTIENETKDFLFSLNQLFNEVKKIFSLHENIESLIKVEYNAIITKNFKERIDKIINLLSPSQSIEIDKMEDILLMLLEIDGYMRLLKVTYNRYRLSEPTADNKVIIVITTDFVNINIYQSIKDLYSKLRSIILYNAKNRSNPEEFLKNNIYNKTSEYTKIIREYKENLKEIPKSRVDWVKRNSLTTAYEFQRNKIIADIYCNANLQKLVEKLKKESILSLSKNYGQFTSFVSYIIKFVFFEMYGEGEPLAESIDEMESNGKAVIILPYPDKYKTFIYNNVFDAKFLSVTGEISKLYNALNLAKHKNQLVSSKETFTNVQNEKIIITDKIFELEKEKELLINKAKLLLKSPINPKNITKPFVIQYNKSTNVLYCTQNNDNPTEFVILIESGVPDKYFHYGTFKTFSEIPVANGLQRYINSCDFGILSNSVEEKTLDQIIKSDNKILLNVINKFNKFKAPREKINTKIVISPVTFSESDLVTFKNDSLIKLVFNKYKNAFEPEWQDNNHVKNFLKNVVIEFFEKYSELYENTKPTAKKFNEIANIISIKQYVNELKMRIRIERKIKLDTDKLLYIISK